MKIDFFMESVTLGNLFDGNKYDINSVSIATLKFSSGTSQLIKLADKGLTDFSKDTRNIFALVHQFLLKSFLEIGPKHHGD